MLFEHLMTLFLWMATAWAGLQHGSQESTTLERRQPDEGGRALAPLEEMQQTQEFENGFQIGNCVCGQKSSDALITKKTMTRAQAGDMYAKGCLQIYYRRAFSREEVMETFAESRFLFGYLSSMCACEKYQEWLKDNREPTANDPPKRQAKLKKKAGYAMRTAVTDCLQLEYRRLEQLVASEKAQEDGGPALLGESKTDSAEGRRDTMPSRFGALLNSIKSNAGRYLIPDRQRGYAASGIRVNSLGFPRMRVGM